MSLNGRLNECEQIVREYIRPLLAKISKDDIGYRTEIIVTLAPVPLPFLSRGAFFQAESLVKNPDGQFSVFFFNDTGHLNF